MEAALVRMKKMYYGSGTFHWLYDVLNGRRHVSVQDVELALTSMDFRTFLKFTVAVNTAMFYYLYKLKDKKTD